MLKWNKKLIITINQSITIPPSGVIASRSGVKRRKLNWLIGDEDISWKEPHINSRQIQYRLLYWAHQKNTACSLTEIVTMIYK